MKGKSEDVPARLSADLPAPIVESREEGILRRAGEELERLRAESSSRGAEAADLRRQLEAARRELALTGRVLGSANALATRMQAVVETRLGDKLRKVLEEVVAEMEQEEVRHAEVLSLRFPASLLRHVRFHAELRALVADAIAARLLSEDPRTLDAGELIALPGDRDV